MLSAVQFAKTQFIFVESRRLRVHSKAKFRTFKDFSAFLCPRIITTTRRTACAVIVLRQMKCVGDAMFCSECELLTEREFFGIVATSRQITVRSVLQRTKE